MLGRKHPAQTSPGEGRALRGGLLLAHDPPRLPRALAPDSGRVERGAEKVKTGKLRKERNKEPKRGWRPSRPRD